uniref:Uncharacterized protein n=1 Tax=Amphimedon queenslandica TaxID=400682 RepID=A0A1X7UPX6_AMPQE
MKMLTILRRSYEQNGGKQKSDSTIVLMHYCIESPVIPAELFSNGSCYIKLS